MSDFSPTQTQRLHAVAGSSDLIFIGTVRGVGPAPLAWAGRVPSYQSVTYAVDQTLKGSPPPQVTVQHIVVTGAETAEPGDEPSLAKKLFRPGARFVVMATLGDDGAWYSLDERHGAIPFSADTLAMVRAMIAEV